MSDQGKIVITMPVPAETPRAKLISGAGTLSASLRAVGVLYDSTGENQAIGQVQIGGTALVTLGANLSAGATVKSDASGDAVASSTDHSLMCGILLDGGPTGELRRMRII